MFRKTHESSRKTIKTTSLKPGDGITLMRIFDLSGKIPENSDITEILLKVALDIIKQTIKWERKYDIPESTFLQFIWNDLKVFNDRQD